MAMGNYATQSDLEALFGADNIAAWSNQSNRQAAADPARVTSAITRGEAKIDDRFRGSQYKVPLAKAGGSGAPEIVTEWACVLAGVQLFRAGRGLRDDDAMQTRMEAMEDRVHDEMASYLYGGRMLDAETTWGRDRTAPQVVEEDE